MNKTEKILLEIKLPKEISKSPASMEIFFTFLSKSGPGSYSEAILEGKVKPWFSCEYVSDQGEIHIYIWTWKKYKNLVESQLYAQYPNLEIYEVPDYTKKFEYDPERFTYSGKQHNLGRSDSYPIKTYIDYGLDADQKDEYKIDPINSIYESLGALKKEEHAWIQILFQKHQKESRFLNGRWMGRPDWSTDAKSVLKKLKLATIPDYLPIKDKDDKFSKLPSPTKVQSETIAAVERSANKIPFDCAIRIIYFAPKDSFKGDHASMVLGCLKSFNSRNLNRFATGKETGLGDTEKDLAKLFPELFKKTFEGDDAAFRMDIFNAYKLRSHFQIPYRNLAQVKPFVLNAEELATLFHFPSHVVSQTPTLTRVPSKKYEAPSNLPI